LKIEPSARYKVQSGDGMVTGMGDEPEENMAGVEKDWIIVDYADYGFSSFARGGARKKRKGRRIYATKNFKKILPHASNNVNDLHRAPAMFQPTKHYEATSLVYINNGACFCDRKLDTIIRESRIYEQREGKKMKEL
jgi:hypothetical protein